MSNGVRRVIGVFKKAKTLLFQHLQYDVMTVDSNEFGLIES